MTWWIFKGDKNLQYTSIWTGSKAAATILYYFTAYKRTLQVWKKYFVSKMHHFLCPDPPNLLLDGSACRPARVCSGGQTGSFPQQTSSTMKFRVFCDIALCSHVEVDGATSQKTLNFILTAMRTWNLTYHPPWFSMLIYHPGEEQQDDWWPQFRDMVPPHHHPQINKLQKVCWVRWS
jgi:hypothetical protein